MMTQKKTATMIFDDFIAALKTKGAALRKELEFIRWLWNSRENHRAIYQAHLTAEKNIATVVDFIRRENEAAIRRHGKSLSELDRDLNAYKLAGSISPHTAVGVSGIDLLKDANKPAEPGSNALLDKLAEPEEPNRNMLLEGNDILVNRFVNNLENKYGKKKPDSDESMNALH